MDSNVVVQEAALAVASRVCKLSDSQRALLRSAIYSSLAASTTALPATTTASSASKKRGRDDSDGDAAFSAIVPRAVSVEDQQSAHVMAVVADAARTGVVLQRLFTDAVMASPTSHANGQVGGDVVDAGGGGGGVTGASSGSVLGLAQLTECIAQRRQWSRSSSSSSGGGSGGASAAPLLTPTPTTEGNLQRLCLAVLQV